MGTNNINHPECYQLKDGREVMDMIVALEGDPSDFIMGEVHKHTTRWYNEHKNGVNKNSTEDLENTVWYLQYLIAHIKGEVQKEIDAFVAKQQGGMING